MLKKEADWLLFLSEACDVDENLVNVEFQFFVCQL